MAGEVEISSKAKRQLMQGSFEVPRVQGVDCGEGEWPRIKTKKENEI